MCIYNSANSPHHLPQTFIRRTTNTHVAIARPSSRLYTNFPQTGLDTLSDASQQWRFFTPGAHKAIRSLWRALLPPRATLERANSSLLGPSSLEKPIRAPRGSKLTFRCLHSLNALGARVLPFDLIASKMATTSSSSSITRKDLDQVGTTAFASYLDRSSSHGFSTYSTYSSRKRRC